MSDKETKRQDVRISNLVRVESVQFPSSPNIPIPTILGGTENIKVVIPEPCPQSEEEVRRLSEGMSPISMCAHLITLWQNFYYQNLPNLGVSPKLEGIVLQAKSFSDILFAVRPSNTSSLIIIDKELTIDHILKCLIGSVSLSPDLARSANIDDFFVSDRPPLSQHYGVWMFEAMEYAQELDNQLSGLTWNEIAKRKIKCSTLIEHLLAILYLRHSPAWAMIKDDFEDMTLCAGSHTRRPIKLNPRTKTLLKGRDENNPHWIPYVHTKGDLIEISIMPPNISCGMAHQIVSPYINDYVGR